jgi:hypothetical protein
MRWPRIGFSLLTLLSLSMLPLPAQALLIQFCIPACQGTGADPTPRVFGPGTPVTDANGVTTNSIPLGTFTHTRGAVAFTITATVASQQSATLQKITFNPTSITANSNSACSTTAPCRIEVIATSDQLDFPAPKPVGGYPAGTFMVGSFTGLQAPSPNGDTISSTGEASGTRLVSVTGSDGATQQVLEPVNTDVVNATPGTGPGNTGTSLPSSCTGKPTCKFIATSLKKGFSTKIEETVQQQCDSGVTCLTRLRTRLNIEIKRPGNKVSLPHDWVTANNDPDNPEVNPTEQLIAATVATLGNFEVNSLAVGPQHFVMKANLALGEDAGIDPANEEVYVRVGPFSTTILPGLFKRLQDGRLFTFHGKVDGLQINATFARDRKNESLWEVIIAVYGIQLADVLPQPPLEVPVEIVVGSDSGKGLVTAKFFGTGK